MNLRIFNLNLYRLIGLDTGNLHGKSYFTEPFEGCPAIIIYDCKICVRTRKRYMFFRNRIIFRTQEIIIIFYISGINTFFPA